MLIVIRMWSHRTCSFKMNGLKLKLRAFLILYAVAMVTFCITKMTKISLPRFWHLFVTFLCHKLKVGGTKIKEKT